MNTRLLSIIGLTLTLLLHVGGAFAQDSTSAEGSRKKQFFREETQEVNEEDVHGLFQTGGVSARDLVGHGFTYRHDWGDKHGQWVLHLNTCDVNRDSRVFVEIGECDPAGGKFIGAARYTVHNVAPNHCVVSIWANIEWGSPIRVCADYLVINP
jgi:hypothetical protein